MEFELHFDSRINVAKKEYDNYINTQELVGKKDYILSIMSTDGFEKVPVTLNKPLKGLGKGIYQMTLSDFRVIYIKKRNNKLFVICAYHKTSDGMPKNIRKNIIDRAKKVNKWKFF